VFAPAERVVEQGEAEVPVAGRLAAPRNGIHQAGVGAIPARTSTAQDAGKPLNTGNLINACIKQFFCLKNKRLLYVAEKGAAALDHSHMNGDSIQDQYLYSSIDELQARNLELAEELERLRDEQDKIIENYHNTEYFLFL